MRYFECFNSGIIATQQTETRFRNLLQIVNTKTYQIHPFPTLIIGGYNISIWQTRLNTCWIVSSMCSFWAVTKIVERGPIIRLIMISYETGRVKEGVFGTLREKYLLLIKY